MKLKISRLTVGVVLVLVVTGLTSVRRELLNVPRVRVGPLHSDVPAGPVLRFFAVGNTGASEERKLEVASAMEARCQAAAGFGAILLLGDNTFAHGAQAVEDQQWQERVLDPYSAGCLGKLPIYAVLGNDDYRGNPEAEIEYSLVNPRWHMPNRFYSVSFGSLVRLVALDSNFSEVCFRSQFCSIDFLAASLKGSDAEWTLVMAHHRLDGLRGLLLRPYLCGRTDIYLSGDRRSGARSRPEDCRMEELEAAGGFVEIEASESELTTRVINPKGVIVSEEKKGRGGGREAVSETPAKNSP